MPYFDTHVCLISAQAAANLLPILDKEFKPKKAIFLVSQEMKREAAFLANTFKNKDVNVEQYFFTNVYDFHKTENEILDVINRYNLDNIALNVTGGTKLLAIAAQNIFALANKPIFYMDTTHNSIIFVSKDKDGNYIDDKVLKTKFDLETYLSSYGSTILKKKEGTDPQEYISIARHLATKFDTYKDIIPVLNLLAAESRKNGYKVKVFDSFTQFKKLQDLLNYLKYSTTNFIDYYHNTIDFKNERIRSFLNGGWLEDYVFCELEDIAKIDDIQCNLEVGNSNFDSSKSQFNNKNLGNMNEFDITFIAKNRLHIIECKTQKMDKDEKNILSKLETLKKYGGLFTKKCLVSYMPVSQAIKNRAKELDISVIEGKDIQRIKQKVQEWIG